MVNASICYKIAILKPIKELSSCDLEIASYFSITFSTLLRND